MSKKSYYLAFLLCHLTVFSLFGQIPQDGLTAYFPFYTNPDFQGEYSENIIGFNTALWVGNISPTMDRFGNENCALSFDGDQTTLLILQPSDVFHASPSGELSISLWINGGSDNDGDLEVLFRMTTLNGGVPIYNFTLHDLNKPNMYTSESSLWAEDNVLPFPSDNQWHHLVAVFESGAWKIYIDNDSSMSQSAFGPQLLPEAMGQTPVYGDIAIGENFEGAMDDLTFYQKALNPEEVNQLFYATSDCGVVGLNEIEEQPTIDLFPNPAYDVLQLNLNDHLMDYLEIYNATGQLVLTKSIDPFEPIQVDISSLAKGMYSIQTFWNNEVLTKEKFIVQR